MFAHAFKALSNKRLHRSVAALAGLTSALSVLVGLLAAFATPHGWGRVTMVLHITKKPLILKIAPYITGVSMAVATAAGLLGFYIWMADRDGEPEAGADPEAKAGD